MLAGLDRRRRESGTPITLLSCDNIQGNGDLLRRHLTACAELRDSELARWIGDNCAFPNSMVDRITPATTDEDRSMVRREFQIDDGWPVMTEAFRQWVIEDRFALGRPRWEACGVQFTDDVAPYEKIKLRLLNGGHQALCYIGTLLGYSFVHEAIGDPAIRKLVQLLMDHEVTPSLAEVPGIDLTAYKGQLLERFANTAIRDRLSRIGYYGSSGIPQFLLPTVREQLARGGPITLLGFVIASWFRCLDGRDDQGRELTLLDPMASKLQTFARRAREDPSSLLLPGDLFGPHLAPSVLFRKSVSDALACFYRHGARETLTRYVAQCANVPAS